MIASHTDAMLNFDIFYGKEKQKNCLKSAEWKSKSLKVTQLQQWGT